MSGDALPHEHAWREALRELWGDDAAGADVVVRDLGALYSQP